MKLRTGLIIGAALVAAVAMAASAATLAALGRKVGWPSPLHWALPVSVDVLALVAGVRWLAAGIAPGGPVPGPPPDPRDRRGVGRARRDQSPGGHPVHARRPLAGHRGLGCPPAGRRAVRPPDGRDHDRARDRSGPGRVGRGGHRPGPREPPRCPPRCPPPQHPHPQHRLRRWSSAGNTSTSRLSPPGPGSTPRRPAQAIERAWRDGLSLSEAARVATRARSQVQRHLHTAGRRGAGRPIPGQTAIASRRRGAA